MKKFIIILVMIVAASLALSSAESQPFPQTIYGYVYTMNYMSVSIDHSMLPFNILSEAVKRNQDTSYVSGLRLGSISFTSNDASFRLNISHDKLKSDNSNQQSELDYRLDVFYANNYYFVTCYAGQTVSIYKDIVRSTDPSVFSGSPYIVNDQSIYISMNESDESIENAADGTYSSTITFELTVSN